MLNQGRSIPQYADRKKYCSTSPPAMSGKARMQFRLSCEVKQNFTPDSRIINTFYLYLNY